MGKSNKILCGCQHYHQDIRLYWDGEIKNEVMPNLFRHPTR
jgi:hypothetical protein